MSSYYDELGVKPDASDEEIRQAFRRKAKQAHPDKKGGDAAKMTRLNKAYETLSQPQRRLTYDRTGEDKPKDIDHVAREIVGGRIIAWLHSEQNTGDLIADVARNLTEEERQQLVEIGNATTMLERLRKRIKKLKFKGKGIDVVSAAIKTRIAGIKQDIEKMKDHVAHLKRAKELLHEGYEFEPETQIQTSIVGTFMSFGQ